MLPLVWEPCSYEQLASGHEGGSRIAEPIMLPSALCNLHHLRGVLSLDVWRTLSKEEQQSLIAFLPPECTRSSEDTDRLLENLFSNEEFHFVNPLTHFHDKFKAGRIHSSIVPLEARWRSLRQTEDKVEVSCLRQNHLMGFLRVIEEALEADGPLSLLKQQPSLASTPSSSVGASQQSSSKKHFDSLMSSPTPDPKYFHLGITDGADTPSVGDTGQPRPEEAPYSPFGSSAMGAAGDVASASTTLPPDLSCPQRVLWDKEEVALLKEKFAIANTLLIDSEEDTEDDDEVYVEIPLADQLQAIGVAARHSRKKDIARREKLRKMESRQEVEVPRSTFVYDDKFEQSYGFADRSWGNAFDFDTVPDSRTGKKRKSGFKTSEGSMNASPSKTQKKPKHDSSCDGSSTKSPGGLKVEAKREPLKPVPPAFGFFKRIRDAFGRNGLCATVDELLAEIRRQKNYEVEVPEGFNLQEQLEMALRYLSTPPKGVLPKAMTGRDTEFALVAFLQNGGGRRRFCICRSPLEFGFMITCDTCKEWYHGECIGLTALDGEKMESYVCEKCQTRLAQGESVVLPIIDGKTDEEDAAQVPRWVWRRDDMTPAHMETLEQMFFFAIARKMITPSKPMASVPKKQHKTPLTIAPTPEDIVQRYHELERERYESPSAPYTYRIPGHFRTTVAPLPVVATKARDHFLLSKDRPPHINLLCVVKDAVARLPGGVGTRPDVATLLKDSQYVVMDGVTDAKLNSVVSGALDRLQHSHDSAARYSADHKLWTYMHRIRSESDWLTPEANKPAPVD